MEHLTPKQQKLVEDNHNLIYSLAYKKNINLDEFYGDLAIGLCKAAIIFDERKGRFSTLAYTSMYNEYKMRIRRMTAARIVPPDQILSMDIQVQSEDSDAQTTTFANLIPDEKVKIEHDVITRLTYESLSKNLKDDERIIMEMLMDGMTQSDISRHFGLSRQCTNNKIRKIRNKLSCLQ